MGRIDRGDRHRVGVRYLVHLYARRKPDPIEEARRADMFARGWTPLDEDVHFLPAWFAKISKLRTIGSEMPHTTWGKDG